VATQAVVDRKQLQRRILAALDADIARPRPGILYRTSLLVVSGLVVLLPLLYVALAAALAWFGFWYATNFAPTMGQAHVGSLKLRIILYIAPVLACAVTVLFMLKPLFAPAARVEEGPTLSRKSEPFLFAYVDRICDHVGAPKPSRIDLDCQINASASFRGGMSGVFANDLVLTIGLPLVAGMDLRQLTGVLSHELGHFSQGTGMRLGFMIHSINRWFARVVHLRDSWDATLETTSTGGMFDLVILAVRGNVWLTRQVLRLFMTISHGFSCWMDRQMELDADRYATCVTGPDNVRSMLLQLHLVNASNDLACARLADAWREKKLGDDLPALVGSMVRTLPQKAVGNIAREALARRTRAWDTHPCIADRAARAAREAKPGAFHLDLPATALFEDFPALSRKATLAFYHETLDPSIGAQHLVSSQHMEERQERILLVVDACRRFFQGTLHVARPPKLGVSVVAPPADPGRALAELRGARAEIEVSTVAARAAFRRFSKAEEDALHVHGAETIVGAGVAVDAESFRLPTADLAGVARAMQRAQQVMDEAAPALDRFDALQHRRMLAALTLLHHPEVQARVEGAPMRVQQAQSIVATLATLEGALAPALTARRHLAAFSALASAVSQRQGVVPDLIVDRVHASAVALNGSLGTLRGALGSARHPLTDPPVLLRDHVIAQLPPAGDPLALLRAAKPALAALFEAQRRMLGNLCETCELVEAACGLAPLPMPPDER
jgi:hypothetical protein